MTDGEIVEAIARERQAARIAARDFATACGAGDVDAFYSAANRLNRSGPDAWRLAMRRVPMLAAVGAEIRAAFLEVWIQSKMLPLKIGDRRVLVNALRLLMPCNYSGPPVQLFRGANWLERCRHRYGFSWTRDRVTARRFADHWAGVGLGAAGKAIALQDGGGVVLEAQASAAAILLMRDDEGYYDEREVVIDPFRLGSVTVSERVLPTS